jgi:uncharacterized membrane protein
LDDGKGPFLLKIVSRYGLAALFLCSGTLHFVAPGVFVRIVPPILPWPGALVAISGAAEIAGAVGLLTVRWRRLAACGLTALLIAVFPANVYMAMQRMMFPEWVLWARLPLQFLLIWWVWVTGRVR